MILGQWVATRPDLDVGYVSGVMRQVARRFGVTKPVIGKQIVTREMADQFGYPYPADIWTWKGTVNLLALPKHLIGSNPHSAVLDGGRYRIESID